MGDRGRSGNEFGVRGEVRVVMVEKGGGGGEVEKKVVGGYGEMVKEKRLVKRVGVKFDWWVLFRKLIVLL